jgi:hypothetical protein
MYCKNVKVVYYTLFDELKKRSMVIRLHATCTRQKKKPKLAYYLFSPIIKKTAHNLSKNCACVHELEKQVVFFAPNPTPFLTYLSCPTQCLNILTCWNWSGTEGPLPCHLVLGISNGSRMLPLVWNLTRVRGYTNLFGCTPKRGCTAPPRVAVKEPSELCT